MLAKAELIVHNTAYHQCPNGQPGGMQHRYSQQLASDDPPFTLPTLILKEEWQRLPCGHVDNVGAISIRNDEGTFPITIPTDQERDEMSWRVIEIAAAPKGYPLGQLCRHAVIVRPGCSQILEFSSGDPQTIWIRCRRGTARCWLMVVPG